MRNKITLFFLALVALLLGFSESHGKSIRGFKMDAIVDSPEIRIEGGRIEKGSGLSGWKSVVSSEPPDARRKDGIVLQPFFENPSFAERGTLTVGIFRSPEAGGSGYNTILSLVNDNDVLLNLYVTWRAMHGPSDNVTAIWISGKKYVGDGAPVFGRSIYFNREVKPGEWALLAITWGPNGKDDNKIYLNNKEAEAYLHGNDPAPRVGNFGKYLSLASKVVVGSSPDGADTFYQGLIGDLDVYDSIETVFDLSRYRPQIRSVADNFLKATGISGKLVAGDSLTVKMEADPGGKASCDIGSVSGIPMVEDTGIPGMYLATHVIPPGEFLDRGRVTARYSNPAGVPADPMASASGDISIDSRSRFALSIDKTDLPADSNATARVKVKVTDANGNPVKGHQIRVTLSTTDEYTGLVGGGSARSRDAAAAAKELLAGADVETRWKGVADSWGEVEFDFKSGFAAKTIILQAKDLTSGDVGVDYITSYKEASIDIALTPPISRAAARRGVTYILKVEATRTELTADGRSRSVIRATLLDPNGKPVPGDPVAFALSSPNGTLRTVSGTTDASGVATAEYVAGKKIGIVVITATATLRNATGNVSITLLADAPAKIYLKARPETMPADGNSRADLQVKVTDINDNPNRDTKVEFRLARGVGRLDSPDQVTDRFGDAANRFTAGTTPGIATIVATVRSKVPTEAELASARNVLFASYSDEGEEIRISRWFKRKGDTAMKGEPIVEYTIGRSDTKYTMNAPYDCRLDFLFVEYWDNAKTGDTLARITPVVIPGSTNPLPAQPAMAPRRR